MNEHVSKCCNKVIQNFKEKESHSCKCHSCNKDINALFLLNNKNDENLCESCYFDKHCNKCKVCNFKTMKKHELHNCKCIDCKINPVKN